MLRRRHLPEAQASGKAEGGEKEDENVRQGEHPAGCVHQGAQERGLIISPCLSCLKWKRRVGGFLRMWWGGRFPR